VNTRRAPEWVRSGHLSGQASHVGADLRMVKSNETATDRIAGPYPRTAARSILSRRTRSLVGTVRHSPIIMRPMIGVRYRAVVSSLALVLSFGAAAVSLGITLYLGLGTVIEWLLIAIGWYTPPPVGWLDVMVAEGLRQAVIFMGVFAYFAIFILPVFLLLPLLAPVIASWRTPRRILILRSFNRGWPNRALKRIARRNLSRLGHVYTLADADIAVPWVARASILFGQASLFSFRAKRLTSPASVAKLPHLLDRTWLRNLNWSLSFSKVFPLRSSDVVWRESIETLLPRMDAIVIDLSDTSPNVIWEVQRCQSLGLERRMIYLVSNNMDRDKVVACCSQAFGFALPHERIFVYGARAISAEGAFQRALAQLELAPRDNITASAERSDAWFSAAALIPFAIGFFPELVLAFYPETDKNVWTFYLIQWNAWEGWPHVSEVINGPALAVFSFGLVTFALLMIAARTNRSMRLLVGVQAAIVLVSAFGYFPSAFLELTDLLASWM
jgi:hypothetical protein